MDYLEDGTRVEWNGAGPSYGRPGTIIRRRLCPATKTWEYVVRWDNGGETLLPPEMFNIIDVG